MKNLLSTLVLTLLVITSYTQSAVISTSDQEPNYILYFDSEDVTDWDEFTQFVKNITQAESIKLTDTKEALKITTLRDLDPKIINGKLEKYGVDYIELKQN